MKNELIERVARAIYAVEREGEFPQNELPFDQAFIHDPAGYGQIIGQARAAIEEIEKGGSPCGVCGCLVYKGLPTK